MKIYHYHRETGEYLGEGTAQPDPLEHLRVRALKGDDAPPEHWLIPAGATVEPPPKLKAGQIAIMIDGAWKAVTPPAPPEPEPTPEPTWDLLRRRGYGSYGEQLDMIYRQLKAAGLDGEFTAHIDAVKAAHPKP